MYRQGRSFVIVTRPDGSILKREAVIDYDVDRGTFDVGFPGESALKGYRFSVLQGELKRVRDQGAPASAPSPLD